MRAGIHRCIPAVARAGVVVLNDSSASPPSSLLHADVQPLWQAVRARLDRYGLDRRGRLRVPPLREHGRLSLTSLLGAPIGATIDLDALECALIAHSVGTDLDDALTRLGAPRSLDSEARRQARQSRAETRAAIERTCATWHEPWAMEWMSWLFQSGQLARSDHDSLREATTNTRRLLDALTEAEEPLARTELAVQLFGSAHALDDGVLLERCARRALWFKGARSLEPRDGRAIWSAAGVIHDRVSAPVLGWRLPLAPDSTLGVLAQAATAAGVPLHLTTFALERHPVTIAPRDAVLLVENPRLVEAAAERDTPFAVIATNGNPATAVMRLVSALLAHGVTVRHHGDFDVAGIAICRRLHALGCKPWRMGAADYNAALNYAADQGIELPTDGAACGDTPWDPMLRERFDTVRRQVHEELLIEFLLNDANPASS